MDSGWLSPCSLAKHAALYEYSGRGAGISDEENPASASCQLRVGMDVSEARK